MNVVHFFSAAALLCLACSKATPAADADGKDAAAADAHGTSDGAPHADGAAVDGAPRAYTPECIDDAGCEGDEICTCEGTCLLRASGGCANDKNCTASSWCNPCTRQCEPRVDLCQACQKDGQCTEDGACLPFASGGNYCGRLCLTDAGCPVGYSCSEITGISGSQCIPDSGKCEDLGLCADDGECPDFEICNDVLKVCAEGCQDDLACAGDLVCVAARCVNPCTTQAECTPPAECQPNGHCRVPGACETSAECPDPATYCNKKNGMCVPGCLVDGDCKDAAMQCSGGQCTPKGCQHHYECAFGEECTKAQALCEPSPDPHCAVCDPNDQAACGGEPNVCATLQVEDPQTGQTVDKGSFCFLPCAADPIDKCPAGYGCQAIDGAPADYYCTRACYVDPLAQPGTP